MSYVDRLRALRQFTTGSERIRDLAGPVAIVRLGPARLVPTFAIVSSTQGAHDVLCGSDGSFDKEMTVHVQNRNFGVNSFNLAHEPWLPRRRTIQPAFTKRQVDRYAGHMARAAAALSEDLTGAERVDLDPAMRKLTLQVLGRSVLGLDLGEHAAALGPHIRRLLEWNTGRALRPVRAPLWLPTPARRRMRTDLAAVHTVVDRAIDNAGDSEDAELIRLLQAATDPESGTPLTREQIRAELLAFVVAGHDTTATTLTYALWALGRNQSMQDRVASEVSALNKVALSSEDVGLLPYTVQVLHEALRLCPPAAAVGRMAMRDVVVDGYRISKGTNVVVSCYALHRDRKLWKNAEQFDPDRFSRERSKGLDRWQYFPFGAGPRTCIGSHFAMLEATLGLATIVASVRIESEEGHFPTALPFTLTAGGPIRARVLTRNN